MQETHNRLIAGIHKYFKEAGFEKAVIGVSGGVDSAICLKLATEVLGKENVTAVLMPEKGVSNEENSQHAKALCQFLEVETFVLPINKYLTDLLTLPWKPSNLAQINIKARIRMILLYSLANTRNALVIGTSNKTELMIGYGTKHGDLAADIEFIGSLFKTEVFELAEHIGLPQEFITKKPSAELYSGQTDEEELGMSYKDLDNILKQLEKGLSKEDLITKGINPHAVHKVVRLMEINKHKLSPAPIV